MFWKSIFVLNSSNAHLHIKFGTSIMIINPSGIQLQIHSERVYHAELIVLPNHVKPMALGVWGF